MLGNPEKDVGRGQAESQRTSVNQNLTTPPTISLPKGGGAIRGIGEKFAANPVTGTGTFSVPIATSPGRSGFGPQLTLTYDSGAGNGPFGLGWSLSLPSITRKTDKGTPRYNDAEESDVFILSGAEDLVPVLEERSTGWEPKDLPDRTIDGQTYAIKAYCPRIEGLFARIERWSNKNNLQDVFWRSISRDNITTLYGRSAESRIVDPSNESRIFSWLISESYDDKGNAIRYEYKQEDLEEGDLSTVSEQNRTRTAQRYLKRIKYGNKTPRQANENLALRTDWMFEVVFDFGEHYTEDDQGQPTSVHIEGSQRDWLVRLDPFSTYRSGFEVRSYRLCRRVLMFHHFAELGIPNYLVAATHFTISEAPSFSFITAVTQSRYLLDPDTSSWLKKSLPPVEFEYSEATVDETIRDIEDESLENLPSGLQGSNYQWVDLDGEGLTGILAEQGGAWFYKRNLSALPVSEIDDQPEYAARFAPVECLSTMPSGADLSGAQQFLDLAGDGQLDVVEFGGPTSGFFERTSSEEWDTFTAFGSVPNIEWKDPNLRFVDLTGDGRADILITEDEVFTWYPSLAEDGFGPAETVRQAYDEDSGPRLVFADGTQSIYLSDLSGDGLSDLVRIRNGEVCYWPNCGYGRFGARVTMDHSPWFDTPEQFNQSRIRLADIDGSGTADIIYLGRESVDLYFNHSGNSWGEARKIESLLCPENFSSVMTADLLGNGTACLVWSTSLPAEARRPMRYIDLMRGQKPHLLIKVQNNLGCETEIYYAPSTKFYLADKFAGKPWITKLSFPVHCVEKVTVADKWRNTKFSTTYSYHHGYFDGIEREFRGFGRVEQIDSETYDKFTDGNWLSPYITKDRTLYQPPVKTITWFHTGAFIDHQRILSQFKDEYFSTWVADLDRYQPNAFKEIDLPEADLDQQDLTAEEWREALRACKGLALRQEIYELDVEALQARQEQLPVKIFSAAYHNCHIQRLQPKANNHHSVFLVTESEATTYHYELDLKTEKVSPDPRITHSLNLNLDEFGHVLQSVAVVYGRLGEHEDSSLKSEQLAAIRVVQNEQHIAYNETRFTEKLPADLIDDNRLPVPCEVLTYELTGIRPEDDDDRATTDVRDNRYFTIDELRRFRLSSYYQEPDPQLVDVEEKDYEQLGDGTTPQKRNVEHVRILFFNEELTSRLPFRQQGRLGLAYETYKLALTENLLSGVFAEKLDNVTSGTTRARDLIGTPTISGYLNTAGLAGRFDPERTTGEYWMCSGVAGFAQDAAQRFYLPEKYTDPFGNDTNLEYDGEYHLFIQSSTDAAGNRIAIASDPITHSARFDYRVLAPIEIEDINGNRSEVRLDVLGLVVAAALKGKGNEGDNLKNFTVDLATPDLTTTLAHFDIPSLQPADLRNLFSPMIGNATTRFLYHFGEKVENGKIVWANRPAGVCTIAREQHVASLKPGDPPSSLQIAFECSDGMGNVLMKRSQAEPEQTGGPIRWIVSGKTILNNKGKPVKQYEPYFSTSAACCAEGDVHEEVGVTPIMYYDSAGRLVRTEMPDGTLSRVEFSPWHVTSFDANDTVKESRWYRQRLRATERGDDPQTADANEENTALAASAEEKRAARQATVHSETPSRVILDSLGRDVIAIAHNRFNDPNGPHELNGAHWRDEYYFTFTKLDAEGKPLWIRDARGNLVMQYITPTKPTRATEEPNQGKIEAMPSQSFPCYDIAGNLLFQHSMDAGDRWKLHDAAGKPMLVWDFNRRQDDNDDFVDEQRMYFTEYDRLHRPTRQWLSINEAPRIMVERFEYRDTKNSDDTPNLGVIADKGANLLGQPVHHYDPSGRVEIIRRDFKGNVLELRRKLNNQPTEALIDWQSNPEGFLETREFTQITEVDALNRMTRQYGWHIQEPPNSGNSKRVSVYLPEYNERGLLAEETLLVRARKIPDGYQEIAGITKPQRAIAAITYDVKGHKLKLELGNGTITRYRYDKNTFRLVHLFTQRGGNFPDDCSSGTADDEQPQRPCGLQNLHYTYDPVGNITRIQDDAQQTIYFDNAVVEPSMEYTYDALYRLTSAKGRESAQGGDAERDGDESVYASGFPITDQTPRNYTETYAYDPVGNFVTFSHSIQGDSTNSWTRYYQYDFDNLAKPASNRLWRTWQGDKDWDNNAATNKVEYDHDAHGNMLNLARTNSRFNMRWDERDMIRSINLGGGGWVYYQYDGEKQRTRKLIKRNGGTEERIYLGGYELYRRTSSGAVVEEIESHHLFADEQRVLLVDDVITSSSPADPRPDGLTVNAQTLFRYQCSNHLGSACLELDHQASIISYEEFHPYGTSAYRARKTGIEAPPKRYRYTGMERDEESGLSYHGARYFVSWLAQWSSADPIGLRGGLNLYQYCSRNPVSRIDTSGKNDLGRNAEVLRIGQQAAANLSRDAVGLSPIFVAPQVTINVLGQITGSSQPINQLRSGDIVPDEIRIGTGTDPGNALQLKAASATVASNQSPASLIPMIVAAVEQVQGDQERAIQSTLNQPNARGKVLVMIAEGNGSNPEVAKAYARELKALLKDPETGERVNKAVAKNPNVQSVVVTSFPDVAEARDASLRKAQQASTPTPPTPPPSGGAASWGNLTRSSVRTYLPLVVETEVSLVGGAYVAYTAGLTKTSMVLAGAAEFVPAAGGGLFAGTLAGNATEIGLRKIGVPKDIAQGGGATAAILAGAGVGALVGSAAGGVGALPGAFVGGLFGLAGYYLSTQ